jgi:hypothetical protein
MASLGHRVSMTFRIHCLSVEQLPQDWEGEVVSLQWMRGNGVVGGHTKEVNVVNGCASWDETLEIRTQLIEDPDKKCFVPRPLNLHLKANRGERVIQVNLAAFAQHECETKQTFSLFENQNSFLILRFSCQWSRINGKRLVRVCGAEVEQIPEESHINLGEKDYALAELSAEEFVDDLSTGQEGLFETPLPLSSHQPELQQDYFGGSSGISPNTSGAGLEVRRIPLPIEKPLSEPTVDSQSVSAQELGYGEEITQGRTNQLISQIEQACSPEFMGQQTGSMNKNVARLLQQAEAELEEAKKVKSEYENLIKSLNAQLAEKDSECESLQKKLEDFVSTPQTIPSEEENSKLRDQVALLENSQQVLNAEVDRLKKELEHSFQLQQKLNSGMSEVEEECQRTLSNKEEQISLLVKENEGLLEELRLERQAKVEQRNSVANREMNFNSLQDDLEREKKKGEERERDFNVEKERFLKQVSELTNELQQLRKEKEKEETEKEEREKRGWSSSWVFRLSLFFSVLVLLFAIFVAL